MKSAFSPVVTALLLASGAIAQLMVNTPPSIVECQPTLISWSGGTPAYFLSIVPANQAGAAPLLDFGQVSGTSLTWTANITTGTSIVLTLKDSTGTISQSAPVTIQAGSSTACLTGSSTGSSSSGGAGSSNPTGTSGTPGAPANTPTTPANPPTTPANTPTNPANTPTNPTGTPSSPNSQSSSGTQSTTSPSPTTTSAAKGNVANAAMAGAFGIGAALFALVA